MNSVMSIKAFVCIFTYSVLLATPFTTRADCETVDQAYERLENLRAEITEDRNATLRPLRDFFASQGDAAARVVIARLQDLNSTERKDLPDPNDLKRAMDYILRLEEEGKNVFLRYDLANILADSYPNLSREFQQKSLETIADSFTPTALERTGTSALIHALQRIGPASIPYLLELAAHKNETVRYRAASALMAVRSKNAQSPKVDCNATTKTSAVAAWNKWWNRNQASIIFPAVPSVFDKIERPTKSN